MTLNQLLKEIKEICLGHAQVHNYHFGDVWEYLQQGKVNHASVLVTLNQTQFSTAQIVCSFSIYCMDWVDAAESNETEVLSDTLTICRDIHAKLLNPTNDFDTDQSPSATPFVESFEDLLAGWKMDIDIAIDFEVDRCAVPED
jgi:hypothetical protein